MTLTELSTAAQFNIGVKIIVLNNEEQGMVTQWQSLFFEDRFSHTWVIFCRSLPMKKLAITYADISFYL